ncbi:MAG: epoxyqueuosine reductase QueH [Clostridiaceae bacterium]|jgi:predicted adenine nucleotide alpha hydrolase (AANH) superfamily ATPase|nr:epoxyqueuosine reductase QueH [Clostridiaceae bacterium]
MKMLLHICCAPCAVPIVERFLPEQGMELAGLYFNPNIHPKEEFDKRKGAVLTMAEDYGVPVSVNELNMLDYWRDSLPADKSKRCIYCYSVRLEEAARYASEYGYDVFTTSLLISPYQDHELIASMGEKAALRHGVRFHYEDFRPLYRKGKELARGKQWYIQKYCGCFFSYTESDHPKKPIYFTENEL